MDRLIRRFDAVRDADLMFCHHRGVAYQRDMTATVAYDKAYFEKCAGYDAVIEARVNEGRIALVARHDAGKVLDIGVGAGDFIKRRGNTFGYDVNPHAVAWLKKQDLYADTFFAFKAFTFWDTIEHVDNPQNYLKRVAPGAYVFASLPVFDALGLIRGSKHYRPGEHLYYFTLDGFVQWMALYGFRLLEVSAHEIAAGREGIQAFAFRRDLPDYQTLVGQYRELHATRHYGASGSLYLKYLAPLVRDIDPASILDYGCGRSDLLAYFYADGRRRLMRHDPAISEYRAMPDEPFDLVLCVDVMEHILMADVDRVLGEIRNKSQRAVFVISTKPARARLPNGKNAHVTLLTKSEWLRWINDVFGAARELPTEWDHVLLVKTF